MQVTPFRYFRQSVLLTSDVIATKSNLLTLHRRCDMSSSLEGRSYKITLVKLTNLSFPWLWHAWVVFPSASHISFCLWLLLHTYLSLLTAHSYQTYLDGLSHPAGTEIGYPCSSKIKSEKNVQWFLSWLCQNNCDLVNTCNNFLQALHCNAKGEIMF